MYKRVCISVKSGPILGFMAFSDAFTQISLRFWVNPKCSRWLSFSTSMPSVSFQSAEGFKDAAEKFATEANVEPDMDLGQLDERISIRNHIQTGDIQTAMRLVAELHPEILDDNSKLFFHLQVIYFTSTYGYNQVNFN